jgi:uncharacterized protein involved in exopolysaccharide biosynthesis
MANEYELTLADYLSIMRRHAPYVIGIFLLALSIAVVVAFVIPPTYRATGIILVEPQDQCDQATGNDARKLTADH